MKRNAFIAGFFGCALWAALMLLLVYPHDWVTLTNAPVLLILVSSIYSLLLPLALSLVLSAFAVLMFNYRMVPPVHTFHVDLHEHGILLITMMGVSWLVTYLLRRQKQIAALERLQAQRTLRLMQWSEQLREVDDPHTLLAQLDQLVRGLAEGCNATWIYFEAPDLSSDGTGLNSQQLEGYKACLKENKPMGRSTGRYESLADIYLPVRGKSKAFGVCVCTLNEAKAQNMQWTRDVQALLDQMGLACERRESLLRAQNARELAQSQKTRSLFLTSIAHDQRTPLASIMTSATAILEQAGQLSTEEIKRYAELIHAESEQVARLTDNTLTLARLSGDQVEVPMQFESVEDMVASVFQRLRQRKHVHLPRVYVEPGLPLLKCNMVLVEQVLDNLIDNACKHSGEPATIELKVSKEEGAVLFEVSDKGRGLGIQASTDSKCKGDRSRGMGIGLQLCHAVAHVHGGHLIFGSHNGQGTVAGLVLPNLPE